MKHIQIKPNRLKTRRNTKKGKGKKKGTTKRKTKRRGGVSKIKRRRKGGNNWFGLFPETGNEKTNIPGNVQLNPEIQKKIKKEEEQLKQEKEKHCPTGKSSRNARIPGTLIRCWAVPGPLRK